MTFFSSAAAARDLANDKNLLLDKATLSCQDVEWLAGALADPEVRSWIVPGGEPPSVWHAPSLRFGSHSHQQFSCRLMWWQAWRNRYRFKNCHSAVPASMPSPSSAWALPCRCVFAGKKMGLGRRVIHSHDAVFSPDERLPYLVEFV